MTHIMKFVFDDWKVIYWICLLVFLLITLYKIRDYILNPGFRLIRRGKYQDAIEYFEHLLKKYPNKYIYYHGIAYAYFMQGYWEHSRKVFKLLLNNKYREVESCLFLSLIAGEQGNLSEALEYLSKCKEFNRKKLFYEKLSKFQIKETGGWISFLKMEYEDALTNYEYVIPRWERFIKRKPLHDRFSPLFYRFGKIFQYCQEKEKMRYYFESCIKSAPYSIFAHRAKKELQ